MTQLQAPDGERVRRVLLIAYKIERDKGSEDGTGYHIASELARRPDLSITVISRRNNVELLHADLGFADVQMVGVDVPRAVGFFKRGGRGIILYYYLWQLAVGIEVRKLLAHQSFDVIHLLNFHTDWAPHFLPKGAARTVWGPLAHHKRVPASLLPGGVPVRVAEWLRWLVKASFWYGDPFLRMAVRRTDVILAGDDDLSPPFRSATARTRSQPHAGSHPVPVPERTRGVRPDECFTVLSVGRFVPLKGFHLTLQAVAAFCRALPNARVRLWVIGSGPWRDDLLRCASDLCLTEDVVTFYDWLPQGELQQFYCEADVLLYPSFEAQGLVVAEAMAAGLPVVCLDRTGPAALVRDSGRLVRRDDPSQVVPDLVRALVERHRVWEESRNDGGPHPERAAARAEHERRLSWASIADGIVSAYGASREDAG
jgi:glycosyltransferase involved in cell wall biosynthesis